MRPKRNNLFFVIVACMIIFSVFAIIYDVYDTQVRGCKPTGEQRLVNSIIHASSDAISTLVVQEKLVCKDNSVKWREVYH